jgi:hypothetical protein
MKPIAVSQCSSTVAEGLVQQHADLTQGVGNENLLGQTNDKTAQAADDPVQTVVAAGQLAGDIGIADDRAGDQLRKQRDIGCQADQVFLRFDLPAVDINRIAEDLKGIEADTDRQDNTGSGRPSPLTALTEPMKKSAYLT